MDKVRLWEERLVEMRADTPAVIRDYITNGLKRTAETYEKAKGLKEEAVTNLSPNWLPKIEEGLRALSTKASITTS